MSMCTANYEKNSLIDDKSTLVQVMTWWRQETSHYLSQSWPRSMSSYCTTRPQWVKPSIHKPDVLFPNYHAESGSPSQLPTFAQKHKVILKWDREKLVSYWHVTCWKPSHCSNQCWYNLLFYHENAFQTTILARTYHMLITWWELNTFRPRQNGFHFADNIFNCTFFNENVWVFLIKISLKFVTMGPIKNMLAMVQLMAWRHTDTKLPEPMFWPRSMSPDGITMPQ